MLESQIEKRMGRMIRERGGLYYKFVSPGNSGVPDRMIVLPGGRIIFAELKTQDGQLSAVQRYQIDQMRAHGLEVRVIRGWEQARAFAEEVMP